MNGDNSIQLLVGVGFLVLVLSSLLSRPLSPWTILRGLVGWAVIFGLVYAAVLNRDLLRSKFLGLEERLTYGEQVVEGNAVRIRMSPDGHFWANTTINGKPLRLLIDSGATITALSSDTAAELGIKPRDGALPIVITTANGTVPAKRGNIERLTVGGKLEARNLAVVISPAFGKLSVLGMNFLENLQSWRVEGRVLILEPKSGDNRAATKPSFT